MGGWIPASDCGAANTDARLAALDRLSALDQALELEYGLTGSPLAEWIPVSERLPDHGGTVVCRTADKELRFARVMRVTTYADGTPATACHWMGYPGGQLEVTHWMPLPEPPKP